MYYPYFRGKQYELITIRESAKLFKASGFVPIIEPVKESLGSLQKTLDVLIAEKVEGILIVNPRHGDHSNNAAEIASLCKNGLKDKGISVGVILCNKIKVDEIISIYKSYKGQAVTFIHSGFTEAAALVAKLGGDVDKIRHVFSDEHCGILYRKHFGKTAQRILLRDGFERRKNREHPPIESFSDLHVTFKELGMNGFGDFLIVGDDYSETGGPAYAIAIHLTFIDKEKDEEMYIHHFVSVRQDTPKDPAGKFAEALKKLVTEVKNPQTKILKTEAVKEFLELYDRKHFPGLGYVKKLSMKHHIETMADYLG